MARRKKSLLPKILLLAALCLAGGGLLAVLAGGGKSFLPVFSRMVAKQEMSRPATATPARRGAKATAAPSKRADQDLERAIAERKRLETENALLQRTIDARDREIADLMIQVKLLTEGSHAPEK